MRRKFLSVVLCVCMMMTMAPFAFAAEGDGESNIAVAKIGDTTYTTFDSALDNAKAGDTITLLENVTVHDADETSSRTTIDKSIILDLNGKTIFGPNNMGANNCNFAVLYISADTTIIDSASNGGINTQTNGAYCINVMDGAQLTINAGTYYGGGTAVQVQKGTLIINGGTFNCEPYDNPKYGYKFLINCVDSAYKDGTAKIIIKGGSFINYDPSDSASENPRGNFCAPGYVAVKNDATENPVWTVEDHRVAEVEGTGYTTLASAIAEADGKTVTLLKDVTEDLVIPADKTVTLDLNGKKLTNVSSNTITNNGTLTITGEGTVDNVTHAKAAIYNKGTVTLNGGTYDRSNEDGVDADNAGTNTYYTILNHGKMTVDSSVTVRNKGHHSSLFENGYYSHNSKDGIDNPTLTITSGTYEGGLNTIKNDDDATLTINGGTFTNYTQAAFQNHGTATVTAGSFIANSKYAIDNCGCDATHDPGKLAISGGTFNGTLYIRSAYSNVTISDGYFNGSISKTGGTLTITGGYFTTDPSAYCVDGKTGVSTGKADYPYTVGDKKTDSQPATVDSATVPAKTTSNNNTVKEVASSISGATVENNNATEAATKDIANDNKITADTNISTGSQKKTVSDVLTSSVSSDASKPSVENPVAIVYQTYVDVTVTDAKKSDTSGTTALSELSVELTPMYRVVATTKNVAESTTTEIKLAGNDVTNANAIQIGEPQKLNVPDQEYIIKLALPSNLDTAGSKLSIKHTKENGSIEYYTGIVSVDSGKTYVTFTTNGFSPFVIYAASANVASIGNNVYPSFQAAVDAAQNNDEITLLKGDAVSATMTGSSKTIKVKAGSGVTTPIKVTVNGESKTLDNTTTEVTFTYTRPSSGGPGSSGGSISAPTTYAVNVNAATNGAVAADKKTASKGTTVTVTASPSKGYVVDAVKVVDKDGKDVAVTEKDGKYVFTMPASAVTVTGSFKAETPAPVALPFTDVKSGNWFYDAVKYAYEQGLMTGTSATTFAPNGTMNRAMIVTVLYRLEKSPAVTGASKFTDVPAGQWYSDAVAWAAANKIVNGYDETTFGPMNAVTREQMAAILFRYEQVKGLENVTLEENLNRFPDQNKISAYAIPALQWAVGQKIINGNADGTLDPTGTATRAQVAQIFTNLLNK